MSAAMLTTNDYADRLSGVLRSRHGDSRSAAKRIAASVGAGIGTVRKWLTGEHGADGVHLIRLMSEDDDVLHAVLELAGRADVADLIRMRAKLLEAKRALDGWEP